ncbi:hypothetical protein EVAR_31841_1 [Eumeta japonica]|uniref:Uncharacterized protein n=1 Tax=Eumeta variegata TaxID=151549 RepID=A0A4C1WI48_EUMVA|nr:hypothetical protein EVAR_31841_1 [Eumeta japonica]
MSRMFEGAALSSRQFGRSSTRLIAPAREVGRVAVRCAVFRPNGGNPSEHSRSARQVPIAESAQRVACRCVTPMTGDTRASRGRLEQEGSQARQ